ncbi:hypothetical protein RBSWK_05830 [Rhodopirellula baltica SWK14]|uniref:Uncharacterized protein n=1 Tax=Rhodopirellula baltica SWK14 TaxID=993516 RepID=L7C9A0_RHOBT|nr:hypothetical protein RBSWK_05830 [Rhodopirellula baltica SWK14]
MTNIDRAQATAEQKQIHRAMRTSFPLLLDRATCSDDRECKAKMNDRYQMTSASFAKVLMN